MTTTSPNSVRNLARSRENYRHMRWRVSAAIRGSNDEAPAALNPFLAKSFFMLKSLVRGKQTEQSLPLQVLPFFDRDWPVVEKLQSNHRTATNYSYLRLAADYIIANRDAIRRLRESEAEFSKATLELDTEKMHDVFEAIAPVDRQALFSFKLYAASHSHDAQMIADYFANSAHSEWVKQRLLYPLTFYFINLPSDEDFEQIVDQIFPSSDTSAAEKLVVSILLRNGSSTHCTLAVKCYVSLLCHPFDALDFLILHFENEMAENKIPSDFEIGILKELEAEVKCPRLANLLRFINGTELPYSDAPNDLPICRDFRLEQIQREFFERYLSIDPVEPQTGETRGLYETLWRLRWTRLPREDDFTIAERAVRLYSFCELGRFLDVLLTSIYMVERRPADLERNSLIRQAGYFGAVSPFTICSPRGASANAQDLFGDENVLEARVAESVRRVLPSVKSRWWIKKLHWNLRTAERGMRMQRWFREVREAVKPSGNMRYLSGVNWQWIDEIVAKSRIKPFVGNADAIYVLLIRAIEQRQREPNILKLAIAPKAPAADGLEHLISWLVKEYSSDALAFIRFFLTPPMLLKMGLATNYTAALSDRLNALDICVEEFGTNDDIMTTEQYAQEQKALTATLTFMTLGAAQFEISWETFRNDAQSAAGDNFRAFLAFTKTYNTLSVLSTARRIAPHIYSNRQTEDYNFQNNEWPLVLTIASIIDTFLGHPSYGIEAILAIRIRHDNLRREFALALAEARRVRTILLAPQDKQFCFSAIESELYVALQTWIDKYMHSPKASSSGLFDFVPKQEEMESLLNDTKPFTELSNIVDHILNWIRRKLALHLAAARERFVSELKPSLTSAIIRARSHMREHPDISDTIADQICGVATNAVERRCDELVPWFEFPSSPRRLGLTIDELRMAVEGRFASEIAGGDLTISFGAKSLISMLVPPDLLRSAFDLWSELMMNAIKYAPVRAGSKRGWIRIREYEKDGYRGLVFSSYSVPPSTGENFYEGVLRAEGPMLRSGKSGLLKVASLAATLLSEKVKIRVVSRRHSFHVFVPIRKDR